MNSGNNDNSDQKSNTYNLQQNLWFSGLLHHVVWCLDTKILEDHTTSVFRVEVGGEWKLDIDIGRV